MTAAMSWRAAVGDTASGDCWGKYDRKIFIRTGDGADYSVARRLVQLFLSKDGLFTIVGVHRDDRRVAEL